MVEQDDQLLSTIQQNLTTSEHFYYEEWPTWPFTRLTPTQVRYLEIKMKKDHRKEILNSEEAPF